MNVYRKSLVIQLLLFVMFYIMGVYVIADVYLSDTYEWIVYVVFGSLVVLGIAGVFIYRRKDTTVAAITKNELELIRYLIYGYFAVYVLQLILSGVIENTSRWFEIVIVGSGFLLMMIATVGGVLQYKILTVVKE